MKCTKCEFECCESNEYGTEYYCAVFGNGCNHKLAKRFVSSGYDMKLLERKENE